MWLNEGFSPSCIPGQLEKRDREALIMMMIFGDLQKWWEKEMQKIFFFLFSLPPWQFEDLGVFRNEEMRIFNFFSPAAKPIFLSLVVERKEFENLDWILFFANSLCLCSLSYLFAHLNRDGETKGVENIKFSFLCVGPPEIKICAFYEPEHFWEELEWMPVSCFF